MQPSHTLEGNPGETHLTIESRWGHHCSDNSFRVLSRSSASRRDTAKTLLIPLNLSVEWQRNGSSRGGGDQVRQARAHVGGGWLCWPAFARRSSDAR